ncbi:hypothetical protein SINU_07595 [Sporolactobacillus inulinus CASD]|uniref:Uncharacterized protein n=1 Tax=Sporolactobacillus inulinus CASD TaxID=1069536 RepID=A0A0U1QNZ3_9BACL|nr:hypothetical protein SINU_07595 [Sporolactobacillus inulinus CASD]GEB77717.1 hypothetical protein SIN01_20620 [Sporolactobacillus inulinus]
MALLVHFINRGHAISKDTMIVPQILINHVLTRNHFSIVRVKFVHKISRIGQMKIAAYKYVTQPFKPTVLAGGFKRLSMLC